MAVRMGKVLPGHSAELVVCTFLLNLILIHMTSDLSCRTSNFFNARTSLPKLGREQQNRAETLAS